MRPSIVRPIYFGEKTFRLAKMQSPQRLGTKCGTVHRDRFLSCTVPIALCCARRSALMSYCKRDRQPDARSA